MYVADNEAYNTELKHSIRELSKLTQGISFPMYKNKKKKNI